MFQISFQVDVPLVGWLWVTMVRKWVRYKLYFICLCSVYLFSMVIFQTRLQVDAPSKLKQNIFIKGNFLNSNIDHSDLNYGGARQLQNVEAGLKEKILSSWNNNTQEDSCNVPATTKSFTFQKLEPSLVYVYSGYVDERYSKPLVRVILLMAKTMKRTKTQIHCLFRDKDKVIEKQGIIYEMCENHNKKYGGYIVSCHAPRIKLCRVTVFLTNAEGNRTSSREVALNLIKINHKKQPFEFGICISPLFGNIPPKNIVEFIELSRILGAQHFVFYDFKLNNTGIQSVLDYYEAEGVATIIPWYLPSNIENKDLWYYGQLLAHNDCLYRSMSLSTVLAFNDIDEFIVPNHAKVWKSALSPLMTNNIVGLSFNSAFFDPKKGDDHPSGLITIGSTLRTRIFSRIRTKVMVKPALVFEVGIHHVSKPYREGLTIQKVSTDIAYLHHYRKCVSNYGMQCLEFVEEPSVLQYYNQLKKNYNHVLQSIK